MIILDHPAKEVKLEPMSPILDEIKSQSSEEEEQNDLGFCEKLIKDANKKLLYNNFQNKRGKTIFDTEKESKIFSGDLNNALGIALKNNEEIHENICLSIARLIGSSKRPVKLQPLTSRLIKLDSMQAQFFKCQVQLE